MSDARRHHYVPACYLRHFAIPQDRDEGRLMVYDRLTGKMFPSSPDKSAHERDFYRVEVEGEHANLAEDTYGAIETRFAPVIAAVNEHGTLPTEPITMHELLAFLATQASRTPRVREMQEKIYSDVHMLVLRNLADDKDAFVKAFREHDPKSSDAEAEEMYAEHCKLMKAKGVRVTMDQTTLVRGALELAPVLEDVLAKRQWILGVAPKGTDFITTDDPVHLQPVDPNKVTHPLWSPGFDDANTNVLVPIGPHLLLMGLAGEFDRARLRLSRREVAAINTDLALAARRFIYFTGPAFAQIGADGAVVDGPTDALRRSAAKQSPTFGFFGTA